MFAQLEPKRVRDASVFLGLAQGEAFPCALGVDWLGCAKLRSDTSTGRLEKNQRQQGMRLEGLHVPLPRSAGEVGVESIPGAVHILVQLQCPVLPGTIFHPAVSRSSISPGSVICRSGSGCP